MIFAVLAQAGAIALLYWLFREAQGGIADAYAEGAREELRLRAQIDRLTRERNDLRAQLDAVTLPSIPVAIPCHEDLP